MNNHLAARTPNLSHILSQPNKARGITQFPQTVAEINATSSRFNDLRRYKAPVSIPPGISVSRRRVSQSQERNFSELTITPTVVESSTAGSLKAIEFKDVSNCESTSKQADKKLPELTRILNSQAASTPVILDSFSISNDAAEALIEEVDPLADAESKDDDDQLQEKDKDNKST